MLAEIPGALNVGVGTEKGIRAICARRVMNFPDSKKSFFKSLTSWSFAWSPYGHPMWLMCAHAKSGS
jgi:hypothetical protein